jgi:L-ribulose-5-phosphate 3-epimerase
MIHRREFASSAAGAAVATVLGLRAGATRAAAARFRIGGCDWSLGKEGDPGSFALAKEAGLDGVEVSCGKAKETLPIDSSRTPTRRGRSRASWQTV